MIDKSKALKKLHIILQLEEKADKDTMLGISILKAIKDKEVTSDELIRFIKESAKDSFKVMSDAIGEDLTNEILGFTD